MFGNVTSCFRSRANVRLTPLCPVRALWADLMKVTFAALRSFRGGPPRPCFEYFLLQGEELFHTVMIDGSIVVEELAGGF